MKSLSLTRPLVIMLIGLPGSGKSFFARQFADMFGAPIVSTDFIRHTLFPYPQYAADEDALVQALVVNEIEQLIKTRKTIIIDGGVNDRATRAQVEQMAKKYEYGKLTIWVQTDEPTSLSRSVKRNTKRAADVLNPPMTAESFQRYKKKFTIPTRSEDALVISGKHTYSAQARVVLKKLVAPKEETIVPPQAPTTTRVNLTSEPSADAEPRRRNVQIN